MNFIIRWLVTAVAVGVAVWLVPGMEILGGTDAWVGIAIFGLILSLINISIKPIMQVLSLPISVITLGNMQKLAEAGAVILPAMPGFYHGPQSIRDLVDFVVGRICDQLGVKHDLSKRWGGATAG